MENYAYNEDKMLAGIRAFYAERRAAISALIEPPACVAKESSTDPSVRKPPSSQSLSSFEIIATNARLKALGEELVKVEELANEVRTALQVGASMTSERCGLPFTQTEQAIQAVAKEFRLSREELMYGGSCRNLMHPRALLMALLRLQKCSTPRIGRLLNKHHTTVLYGLEQAEKLYVANARFARAADRLCASLNLGPFQLREAA